MPIDLDGYVPVNQRIAVFHDLFGQGRLVTEEVRVTREPDDVPRGPQGLDVNALVARAAAEVAS